ncbi:MAG: hypothetical protein J6N21_11535 [Butyrivibrio sp.]|nr:hypothetical protein [Butyrivibrio sp.]
MAEDKTKQDETEEKVEEIKDTKLVSNNLDVKFEPEEPHENTIADIDRMQKNSNRSDDKCMINEKSGSSVRVRKNGQINLAAGKYAQYKISPEGRTVETAMESVSVTNRRRIMSEEVVINDHKLNPQLWELTDMKQVTLPGNQSGLVGNFCVYGTVLVKAWEPDLKRYMLIRRPCRMPMFSNQLNLPKIMPELGINDPLEFDEDIYAFDKEKGYQVNAVISDAKSLVGKAGVDRPGIDRGPNPFNPSGNGSGGGNYSDGPAVQASNLSPEKKKEIFNFFKANGYDDIAACGVMGRLEAEHHWSTDEVALHESDIGTCGGLGIAQWQGSRIEKIKNYITSKGKDIGDLNAQLDAVVWEASQHYGMPGRVNGKSSAEEACRIWTDEYEGGASDGKDIAFAKQFYEEFCKK